MNDVDFLTVEAMVNIGVITGIALLTILVIRNVVVGSLLKIAGKTDSVHDDAIVGALKKPLTLIPIGIALFAILQEINLDETYQSYGELLIKSYFYLAVFWSLADAITPIRDFVGEKYDFLTPTLRNWIFRTLKFIAYLVGVVSVLELWGVDAASIIAGLGLFSVALALGAQNFFKNLIGGLLIIGEKRFKQGDWVNIEGVAEGEVEKIDCVVLDNCQLTSSDLDQTKRVGWTVPNSAIINNKILINSFLSLFFLLKFSLDCFKYSISDL